jgi:hypothetical protein
MPLSASLGRTAGAALGLLIAVAPSAQAANLLTNSSFDTDPSGWVFGTGSAPAVIGWSAEDAAGETDSGSLELTSLSWDQETVSVVQCVPVTPGAHYRFGGKMYIAPNDAPILAAIGLRYYKDGACSNLWGAQGGPGITSHGQWISRTDGEWDAPPEALSAAISLFTRRRADGTEPFVVRFDDVILEQEGGTGDDPPDPDPEPEPEPDPPPEPDPDGWFVDPAFPAFRFNVLITAGGSSRLGVPEPVCLPGTVCVSGAVPGRVEVLLRIVGPKPNGYLWPTLFKASTSRFDVWIEQESTGTVKYYLLEGARPGSSDLPGLFDREGFLP